MASSMDVPQATLKGIRAIVDALAVDAADVDELATRTALSTRHVQYALAGARALRLVHASSPRLTAAGRRLAQARPGSPGERTALAHAITRSPMIKAIAPGLLGEHPPSAEDIVQRIRQHTSLSEATARHRARLIVGWRESLLPGRHQLDLFTRSGGGMWRRIELENYRSIAKVRLDLAPFTVVVGANGSGKSNFADALVFAHEVSINAATAIESRGGIIGVRRWRPRKPTDVTVEVRAAATQDALETDYVRHRFSIHSGARGNWQFKEELIEVVAGGQSKVNLHRRGKTLTSSLGERLPEPTDTASVMALAGQLREFARTAPLRNVRRYRLSPELMRQPQLASERSRLDEDGANIATAVRSLRETERMKELIASMAKIVPGLTDIHVEPVGRYLSLKFGQRQQRDEVAGFNATEMSDGALRALGIVVATMQMAPSELLIIEEPEVGIHVGAANLLFEILEEASQRGAVLITTHSADLLDAARDEQILVCEYEAGTTSVGMLDPVQRDVVRQGLFSLAELMRAEPLRIARGSTPARRTQRD
jgi:predicted ATPase